MKLDAPVEILNFAGTSDLLMKLLLHCTEYISRFPPHFVVISIFANDFGGVRRSLTDENGTKELLVGAHPSILHSHDATCLFMPAP